MEENDIIVTANGKKYQVIGRHIDGRINNLRRYNEKTKMWITLSFDNKADIDSIDQEVATILGNREHWLFKRHSKR
ncbi:hypothetical protein [Paenibacillus polysaccharolyticus]|uniref:hypothetical protein n=1 Tax=Paenibacillus polysaccharolyticus TaxID=582692 RepID=UPI00300B2BA0